MFAVGFVFAFKERKAFKPSEARLFSSVFVLFLNNEHEKREHLAPFC